LHKSYTSLFVNPRQVRYYNTVTVTPHSEQTEVSTPRPTLPSPATLAKGEEYCPAATAGPHRTCYCFATSSPPPASDPGPHVPQACYCYSTAHAQYAHQTRASSSRSAADRSRAEDGDCRARHVPHPDCLSSASACRCWWLCRRGRGFCSEGLFGGCRFGCGCWSCWSWSCRWCGCGCFCWRGGRTLSRGSAGIGLGGRARRRR
jgi:hypothetical protein